MKEPTRLTLPVDCHYVPRFVLELGRVGEILASGLVKPASSIILRGSDYFKWVPSTAGFKSTSTHCWKIHQDLSYRTHTPR